MGERGIFIGKGGAWEILGRNEADSRCKMVQKARASIPSPVFPLSEGARRRRVRVSLAGRRQPRVEKKKKRDTKRDERETKETTERKKGYFGKEGKSVREKHRNRKARGSSEERGTWQGRPAATAAHAEGTSSRSARDVSGFGQVRRTGKTAMHVDARVGCCPCRYLCPGKSEEGVLPLTLSRSWLRLPRTAFTFTVFAAVRVFLLFVNFSQAQRVATC
jgi:hypothetical protein